MVSGFLDIPLDGPLDYQAVLAKKEGEWGKEKSYCWGRGGLREQGREENFQKTGRRSARKKEREQQKGRRENVVAKDRKTRETNPSGSFQTLLSLLTRSLFSSPISLSALDQELNGLLQCSFVSRQKGAWMSNSQKRKERKKEREHLLMLFFHFPSLIQHTLFHRVSISLCFPMFVLSSLLPHSHALSIGQSS